jgi:hypothetical protein
MTDDEIQKVAQTVHDMMFNEVIELKLNLENIIYNMQNLIVNEVSQQGNNTRSEVRNSINGISGQLYSIQNRVDSVRRF